MTTQEKKRVIYKLMDLYPTGLICPYCGETHEIDLNHELSWYDGPAFTVDRACALSRYNEKAKTSLYFSRGKVFFKTSSICGYHMNIDESIPFEDVVISTSQPKITWKYSFESDHSKGSTECTTCSAYGECAISLEEDSCKHDITFGIVFPEEDYFKIVPKDDTEQRMADLEKQIEDLKGKMEGTEMTDTRTSTNSTTLPNLWTTSPKDWLEAIKKFGEAHKCTLQWVVAVGAVTIAAKLLKDNKNLSNEGKAMGLPFLEKKADIKRLATLGSAYAIVYGLSKTLFTSKNTADFKEATAKAEELAEKNPSWEKRAEQVLPTAISIIIAYAMTEQPEWSSKIADSSNGIFIKAQTYMGIAKDVILDKLGIDDENAKKIAICIGVAGLLVFLYKGVKDKERLNEMANKFVEVSIKVAKELAPPAFAALATILINEKLWPDDVIDVTFSEIDDEEADAEAQLEEPAKPAKRGRGKKVTETTATDTAGDTADEDCTD